MNIFLTGISIESIDTTLSGSISLKYGLGNHSEGLRPTAFSFKLNRNQYQEILLSANHFYVFIFAALPQLVNRDLLFAKLLIKFVIQPEVLILLKRPGQHQ